jgi:hypothetical protein
MICYNSLGINLFVHICGGKVSNLSFSVKESGCGMENNISSISKINLKTAFNNANTCCENHSVKTSLKSQNSEKADDINFFLKVQHINTINLPSLNSLIGYQLNEFDDISPHGRILNSTVKKGLYLLLQNFRN